MKTNDTILRGYFCSQWCAIQEGAQDGWPGEAAQLEHQPQPPRTHTQLPRVPLTPNREPRTQHAVLVGKTCKNTVHIHENVFRLRLGIFFWLWLLEAILKKEKKNKTKQMKQTKNPNKTHQPPPPPNEPYFCMYTCTKLINIEIKLGKSLCNDLGLH